MEEVAEESHIDHSTNEEDDKVIIITEMTLILMKNDLYIFAYI